MEYTTIYTVEELQAHREAGAFIQYGRIGGLATDWKTYYGDVVEVHEYYYRAIKFSPDLEFALRVLGSFSFKVKGSTVYAVPCKEDNPLGTIAITYHGVSFIDGVKKDASLSMSMLYALNMLTKHTIDISISMLFDEYEN